MSVDWAAVANDIGRHKVCIVKAGLDPEAPWEIHDAEDPSPGDPQNWGLLVMGLKSYEDALKCAAMDGFAVMPPGHRCAACLRWVEEEPAHRYNLGPQHRLVRICQDCASTPRHEEAVLSAEARRL